MEFTSIKELYRKLIPAFNVKKRLIKNSKYQDITNENIWSYLVESKWKKSYGLTISDMVNDIITTDLEDILEAMNKSQGDLNEEN